MNHALELVDVVGDSASGASAGEGRADDERIAANLGSDLEGLLNTVGSACIEKCMALWIKRVHASMSSLSALNPKMPILVGQWVTDDEHRMAHRHPLQIFAKAMGVLAHALPSVTHPTWGPSGRCGSSTA